MIATQHQKEKIEEALEILKKSNRLLVKGSAGVGKTALVKFLLSYLPGKKVLSAPTHTAVGVLEKSIGKQENYKFSTIHRELQYKRVVDPKTGEKQFKPVINEKYPPLKNVSYLIIDEASMIGVDMLANIEKHCPPYCKIVFIGDDKQLFPVGESYKSVFLGKPTFYTKENAEGLCLKAHPTDTKTIVSFEPYQEIELTEIVRQSAENPIIYLSRNLHEIKNYVSKVNEEKGFLYTENKAKIIYELAESRGSNELKYLAWTNYAVDFVNKEVRKFIYGEPKKIEQGEFIIFDEPYKDMYVNNESLEVKEVVEHLFEIEVMYEDNPHLRGVIKQIETLKIYTINPVEYEPGKFHGVRVIHEDSEQKYKQILSKLNANCKARFLSYVSLINFEEQFASFKYAYAMTVHKSQGQTFDKVIVDLKDIYKNKDEEELQSLLYTAITRPRNLVIFNIK